MSFSLLFFSAQSYSLLLFGEKGGGVQFLCSRAAGHMTRNVLELDGGARVSGWTFRGKEREQDVKKQQSKL